MASVEEHVLYSHRPQRPILSISTFKGFEVTGDGKDLCLRPWRAIASQSRPYWPTWTSGPIWNKNYCMIHCQVEVPRFDPMYH